MNRILTLSVLAVLILTLAPTAQAVWTTSATAPSSFRPNRDVTFTYTATSSSAADVPLAWRVNLYTCQDTDGDTWCEPTDANRIDHGQRTINIVGGQTETVTWTVNLAHPEGAYQYHFHTACLNNPCTGSLQPGGAHNKTGTFQLAYTDTWTRQIVATTPTSQGATQTVTYRLTSTSPDDRDLAGSAALASRPPDSPETDLGSKPYSALANTVSQVSWSGVSFPEIGTHRLIVTDTKQPKTTLDVTVRGVHLHVTQPRVVYPEGARFSLYFALEGHGSTPDPAPIGGADISVSVLNGTFTIASDVLRTDGQGRAYANFTAPADAQRLEWRASAAGTWGDTPYDILREGFVDFRPDLDASAIEESLAAIHQSLSEVQLKGVHLDEIGARNMWMSMLRATGTVALVILLILLVAFIAFRV